MPPASKPHSSVSPKAMDLLQRVEGGFTGIGVVNTPSVDDSRAANRAIRELGAYILGLEEQLEALEGAARNVLARMNPQVPWPQEYLDLQEAVSNPASEPEVS